MTNETGTESPEPSDQELGAIGEINAIVEFLNTETGMDPDRRREAEQNLAWWEAALRHVQAGGDLDSFMMHWELQGSLGED